MVWILIKLVLIDLLLLTLVVGGVIYATGVEGSVWSWFRTFQSGGEIKFEAGFNMVLDTLNRPVEFPTGLPAFAGFDRMVERDL